MAPRRARARGALNPPLPLDQALKIPKAATTGRERNGKAPEAQAAVAGNASSPVVLTLPWPPALNGLFATYRGRRIRSRRYEAWRAQAAISLAEQAPRRVEGLFRARFIFVRPDRRRRDLDGLAKGPLDALVEAGVISDDSLAVEITLTWADGAPQRPGGVSVEIQGSDR